MCKVDCLNMSKSSAAQLRTEIENYLKGKFNPPESGDDTLVIIVIPGDYWDIEIYNPKVDSITKEYVEELLEQYK